ncbi:MAG: hypothetical protein RL748_677, partial [Pseudomonadota bacterium]
TRIRRQVFALLVGAMVATPVALVAVILTPSSGPEMNIGAAGHSEYGAIILAIIAVLHAASFLATALNSFFPVVACFVIASLAFDAYKLHNWQSSKSIALMAGILSMPAIWYALAMQSKKDLLFTTLAPFLASVLALLLVFLSLYIFRKRRLISTTVP